MSGEASHDSGRHFFKYRAFDGRQTEPVLLVASPHLTDDHFKKTVVLMLEHHSQGAIGMILNRPTRVRVSTAFQSPQIVWSGNPEEVIWHGGPVMRESCWMLHEPMNMSSRKGTLNIAPDLMVSSSVSSLQELSRNPPSRLRFIRGIAGWGASQLDREISSGMWLSADFSSRFIFNQNHENMWEAVYESMGVNPAFLTFNQGIH